MKRLIVHLALLSTLILPAGAAFAMPATQAGPAPVEIRNLVELCGVGETLDPMALPLICMSLQSAPDRPVSKPSGLAAAVRARSYDLAEMCGLTESLDPLALPVICMGLWHH